MTETQIEGTQRVLAMAKRDLEYLESIALHGKATVAALHEMADAALRLSRAGDAKQGLAEPELMERLLAAHREAQSNKFELYKLLDKMRDIIQ